MDLSAHTAEIAATILGVALLLFGKRLFWIFVGGTGFLLGITAAQSLPGIEDKPDSTVLIVGAIFGVVGILAAIFLKRVALRVAGFMVGVLAAYYAVEKAGIDDPVWLWGIVATGGLIGLILIVTVFESALVILSAITGAMMIVQAVPLPEELVTAGFAGLSILGIVVQFQLLKRSKSKPKPEND